MKNSGESIETALKNTTGNLEYDLDLLQKIMAVQILDALKNSTELGVILMVRMNSKITKKPWKS